MRFRLLKLENTRNYSMNLCPHSHMVKKIWDLWLIDLDKGRHSIEPSLECIWVDSQPELHDGFSYDTHTDEVEEIENWIRCANDEYHMIMESSVLWHVKTCKPGFFPRNRNKGIVSGFKRFDLSRAEIKKKLQTYFKTFQDLWEAEKQEMIEYCQQNGI